MATRHQRRDEARRIACAGHAGEGRRAGFGDQGVRRREGSGSAGITSFPSRSIRASCSGKRPRSPRRRWKPALPGSRSRTSMPTAMRSRAGSAARKQIMRVVHPQGAAGPEAHRVSRRDRGKDPARQPDHPGRGDRHADPARRPERHRREDQDARSGPDGRGDHRPGQLAEVRRVRRASTTRCGSGRG